MLLEEDMETHKQLSPWLASLFVAGNRRREGIGAALVGRLIEEARALGVQRLYLYTPSEEKFYSRRGWSVLERTEYAGKPAVIMEYNLFPSS
jgi:N-acetylglutamate synthase-like GNAT family acetyltransferase